MTTQKNEGHKKEDHKLFVLSELLNLQERVRPASIEELRFIAVNETLKLITYEQAVLWEGQKITALSGVPEVDHNGSYSLFLKKLYLLHLKDQRDTLTLNVKDVKDYNLIADWQKNLPDNLLCAPLYSDDRGYVGLLLLARKTPWQESEKAILEKVKNIYAYDFDLKCRKTDKNFTLFRWLKKSPVKLVILCLLAVFLLYPFRISVIAPAEVIAYEPDLIRAPIEGIIEDIYVKPNERVSVGQELLKFDQAALIAQREISESSLKSAQAELRQVSQDAMNNPQARLRLSVLEGRVETEKANLTYYNNLLDKSVMIAPKDGVVIFEDIFDWLGRPVSIGERMMLLAEPNQTLLEIRLPVHEAISLDMGDDILFFSNANPDHPITADLSFHSYRATIDDEGQVSYRLKGTWSHDASKKLHRLGLKGSAKLYGDRQPLLLQILRKPLTFLRSFFGI